MIFGVADNDPKLKTWADLVSKSQCARFYEMWHSQRIEHANYEYINWNWWPWPKITNLWEICPQNWMCSNFYGNGTWNMLIMNIVFEIDDLDPKL